MTNFSRHCFSTAGPQPPPPPPVVITFIIDHAEPDQPPDIMVMIVGAVLIIAVLVFIPAVIRSVKKATRRSTAIMPTEQPVGLGLDIDPAMIGAPFAMYGENQTLVTSPGIDASPPPYPGPMEKVPPSVAVPMEDTLGLPQFPRQPSAVSLGATDVSPVPSFTCFGVTEMPLITTPEKQTSISPNSSSPPSTPSPIVEEPEVPQFLREPSAVSLGATDVSPVPSFTYLGVTEMPLMTTPEKQTSISPNSSSPPSTPSPIVEEPEVPQFLREPSAVSLGATDVTPIPSFTYLGVIEMPLMTTPEKQTSVSPYSSSPPSTPPPIVEEPGVSSTESPQLSPKVSDILIPKEPSVPPLTPEYPPVKAPVEAPPASTRAYAPAPKEVFQAQAPAQVPTPTPILVTMEQPIAAPALDAVPVGEPLALAPVPELVPVEEPLAPAPASAPSPVEVSLALESSPAPIVPIAPTPDHVPITVEKSLAQAPAPVPIPAEVPLAVAPAPAPIPIEVLFSDAPAPAPKEPLVEVLLATPLQESILMPNQLDQPEISEPTTAPASVLPSPVESVQQLPPFSRHIPPVPGMQAPAQPPYQGPDMTASGQPPPPYHISDMSGPGYPPLQEIDMSATDAKYAQAAEVTEVTGQPRGKKKRRKSSIKGTDVEKVGKSGKGKKGKKKKK